MDHDRIEEEHVALLWAQCAIAARALRPGGCFVVKMFEGLCPCTRNVVAALTHLFDTVAMIKPTSSRPTNSERYLVCRWRNATPPVDDPREIVTADDWNAAYHAVATYRFADAQLRALRAALASV